MLVLNYDTITFVNNKQKQTLEKIFQKPIPSDIDWSSVESLLRALGAEITQGNGSRIRVKLNGERAVFHRPHPDGKSDKGAVASLAIFLEQAGCKP